MGIKDQRSLILKAVLFGMVSSILAGVLEVTYVLSLLSRDKDEGHGVK